MAPRRSGKACKKVLNFQKYLQATKRQPASPGARLKGKGDANAPFASAPVSRKVSGALASARRYEEPGDDSEPSRFAGSGDTLVLQDSDESSSGPGCEVLVQSVVMLCGSCRTVLADSWQVCGEDRRKGIIACAITHNVKMKEDLELGLDSWLTDCVYYSLNCSGCKSFVGVVLHSTPPALSSFRNLFLLMKEHLICYILNTCEIVKGTDVLFDQHLIGDDISKLKSKLIQLHQRVAMIEEKLARCLNR
ncbi:protein Mis18-beta-like isoform X2 [Lepisosteus oculatus]|uniref:protein Mis18-beta-like isoform X2 n=1 Tax=Lepisosteus oculatus TaxID=7918 RepID=UPI0035F5131B